MPGYTVDLDEVASDLALAREGGIPFEVAKRAVLEELAGIEGDIAEGDVGGRLEDDPDMVSHIDGRREELEARTESDYRPDAPAHTAEQAEMVRTLVRVGETVGFYEMVETDEVAGTVQSWIDGKVTLDDVAASAAGTSGYEELVEFAVSLGAE